MLKNVEIMSKVEKFRKISNNVEKSENVEKCRKMSENVEKLRILRIL